MALAGFTGEQNTLWKEQCKNSQLKHPYLKAMFAFLTLDTDTYVEILVSMDTDTYVAILVSMDTDIYVEILVSRLSVMSDSLI